MTQKKEKQKRMLTMRSSVKTLAIKCYEEQMPDGWEAVKERIKKIPKRFFADTRHLSLQRPCNR